MFSNAVGFNPSQSVLSGLKTTGNAGAYARGAAMQGGAEMGMKAAQQNQQMGVQQMQQQSEQRQKANANQTQKAGNQADESLANESLANRNAVFNTGMNYQYAQMQNSERMRYLQQFIDRMAAG
jgi:hypothetical protein